MNAVNGSQRIQELEDELANIKREYLQSWGWKETCNTPGSFWVWTRDFADLDSKGHDERPYGTVMATIDLAVSMTRKALEPYRAKGTDGEGE